jgi:hypothetical protein
LHIYRKEGKPIKTVSSLSILLVVSAFIGARFFHLLLYEPRHLWAKALTIILPFETEPSFNLLDQSEFSVLYLEFWFCFCCTREKIGCIRIIFSFSTE